MCTTDEEACQEPLEQDHPLYHSEVPLAVVLDDRLEVTGQTDRICLMETYRRAAVNSTL